MEINIGSDHEGYHDDGIAEWFHQTQMKEQTCVVSVVAFWDFFLRVLFQGVCFLGVMRNR